MKTIKSIMTVCLGFMLSTTISAQMASVTPNWEIGDKVSYSFEQKSTSKSGKISIDNIKSIDLDLKVVDKNNDGYIINASYQNLTSSNAMEQAFFGLCRNLSFDYKTDISGKLIGLADSAKVVSDIKSLYQINKSDSTMVSLSFFIQFAGAMMSDEMYLIGLLDEVNYIHTVNGLTLNSKKKADYSMKKKTTFGFDVPVTTHYTLKSVKDNIATVTSVSNVKEDEFTAAFINFALGMTQKMFEGMSNLCQKKEEDNINEGKNDESNSEFTFQRFDDDNFLEKQRSEIEKNLSDKFDLKMSDSFTYSFDQSTQWLLSMNGSLTIKGKVDGQKANSITQIKIVKK